VRRFLVPLVLLSAAPGPAPARAVGLEIQGYPAGVVVDGFHATAVSDRMGMRFLAGWNFTDRRDFGEHEDEHGGGPGLGLAAWRWSEAWRAGWGIGARLDLWWLDIDWQEGDRRGETEVLVLQPTVRVGHGWGLRERTMRLELSLSLGAEINVDTRGEGVGEGAILLAGVAVAI